LFGAVIGQRAHRSRQQRVARCICVQSFVGAPAVPEVYPVVLVEIVVASNQEGLGVIGLGEWRLLSLVEVVRLLIRRGGYEPVQEIEEHEARVSEPLLFVGSEEEEFVLYDRSAKRTTPLLLGRSGNHVIGQRRGRFVRSEALPQSLEPVGIARKPLGPVE